MINHLARPGTIKDWYFDNLFKATVHAMKECLEDLPLRGLRCRLIQKSQMPKKASHELSERGLLILLEVLPDVKHDIIGQ